MNACALLPRGGAPSFRLARGGAQATSTLRTALRSTVAIHTHTRGHHATHYYSLPSTVTSSKPHLRLIARPILRSTRTMSSSTEAQSFYDLKADLPKEGEVLDLSSLKGKVVLVVNVASKCGFTPQYKGLQALYDKYKDRGFVILGFPCNQFGGQEPGSDTEIAEFCELNHGVNFPLMRKSDVNGDNTNSVFQYLKGQKSGLLGLTRIKWNFEKFLIDKNGNVVNRWASTTDAKAIDPEVEKLLNEASDEQTAKI